MNTTFLLSATEQGVAWGDFIFYIVTFLILLALVKKVCMDSYHGYDGKTCNKNL